MLVRTPLLKGLCKLKIFEGFNTAKNHSEKATLSVISKKYDLHIVLMIDANKSDKVDKLKLQASYHITDKSNKKK